MAENAGDEHVDGSSAVLRVVSWYFAKVYGRWEGPGVIPFYCDSARVGAFAIHPEELAEGRDAALFRLFVCLAMFQALRDVVIMRQQRTMSPAVVEVLASRDFLAGHVSRAECEHLASAEVFDLRCSVRKAAGRIDCLHRPGAACQVKDATLLFRRMGDMGKLPTSAWLHVWEGYGLARILAEVVREEPNPRKRADQLVERFARIHRVGRKLATMFVSALSTPVLAPGLTPWFPQVDGNELVVIDTNVARAVDVLREPDAAKTYEARARWLRIEASMVDLRQFGAILPLYSPRLVQQALYAFSSKSNRVASGDECANMDSTCEACATKICPFAARSAHN